METPNVPADPAHETASPTVTVEPIPATNSDNADAANGAPKASYVKLAMRNMVRKRGTSLKHFFLTTAGLLAVLVGLSYLTR